MCIFTCACIWLTVPLGHVWIYWPNQNKKERFQVFISLLHGASRRCEETIRPPSGKGLQPFLQSMQDSKWAASPGTAVSVPKLQWFCCTVTCFQYRQEQSFPLRILKGHRGFWRWTVVDFTLIIGSELFTNYVTVLSSIWDAQKSYQYQSSKWVMVDYHRASLTECVCPVLFL